MQDRRSTLIRNLSITGVALALIYPLSLGPIGFAAFVSRSDMLRDIVRFAYTPLFWVLDRSPTLFLDLYMRYLALWIGRSC